MSSILGGYPTFHSRKIGFILHPVISHKQHPAFQFNPHYFSFFTKKITIPQQKCQQ